MEFEIHKSSLGRRVVSKLSLPTIDEFREAAKEHETNGSSLRKKSHKRSESFSPGTFDQLLGKKRYDS